MPRDVSVVVSSPKFSSPHLTTVAVVDLFGSISLHVGPQMGTEELRQRIRLLDNEIRIMRSDMERIGHESNTQVI